MVASALITGATGCIGRHLVARLLAEGVACRALVLPGDPNRRVLGPPVDVVEGDIAEAQSVRAAAAGTDTIFHLAAVVGDWAPRALFDRVTIRGTHNVIDAAREASARLVLVSSVTVYGDAIARESCAEDRAHGKPQGMYSASKQAQERMVLAAARDRALAYTIVRPANIYGPASQPWVHEVINQLRKNAPTYVGSGDQLSGLVYVDNVVDVLVRAANSDVALGRTYNASDGTEVTWRQYMTDMSELAKTPPPRGIARPLAIAGARAGELWWKLWRLKGRPPLTRDAFILVASHNRFPMDRAASELGYSPVVDYAEGLRRTRAYLDQLDGANG